MPVKALKVMYSQAEDFAILILLPEILLQKAVMVLISPIVLVISSVRKIMNLEMSHRDSKMKWFQVTSSPLNLEFIILPFLAAELRISSL